MTYFYVLFRKNLISIIGCGVAYKYYANYLESLQCKLGDNEKWVAVAQKTSNPLGMGFTSMLMEQCSRGSASWNTETWGGTCSFTRSLYILLLFYFFFFLLGRWWEKGEYRKRCQVLHIIWLWKFSNKEDTVQPLYPGLSFMPQPQPLPLELQPLLLSPGFLYLCLKCSSFKHPFS